MKAKYVIVSIVVAGIIVIVGANQFGGGDVKGVEGEAVKEIAQDTKKEKEPAKVVKQEKDPEVFDVEFTEWASEANEMLSAPLKNSKLEEANNDEGYEYYLKAQKVIETFPQHLGESNSEIEENFTDLFKLESEIVHHQFVRTSHIDPNGEAKDKTDLSDQWKPTDDEMRRPFEEMKKIVNEIDTKVNQNT